MSVTLRGVNFSGGRAQRRILVALVALFGLGVAAFGAAGWYYAGQIGAGALVVDHTAPAYNLTVRSYTNGQVLLRPAPNTHTDDRLRTSGEWGLTWPGGTGVVTGSPQPDSDGAVARALRVNTGVAPAVGTPAVLNNNVWTDPTTAYGDVLQNITYPCTGGTCPAWYIPGRSSTWFVAVHGDNTTRSETLRALGPALTASLPALLIAYRNDPGAPPDPSGRHQQGATEWRDLAQAVDYATDHGARHVVLFGASMGGAIVASFLQHSPAATPVTGIVLDAPMLDLRATVDYGATQRTLPLLGTPLPQVLTGTAEWLASWRYDLNWEQVNYLPGTWIHVPTLIFHGAADDTVPISTSQQLRAAHPDLVQLVPVPGAGHVQSWNLDPTGYETHESAFLTRVTTTQLAPARPTAK
jgi:hypothetical protein